MSDVCLVLEGTFPYVTGGVSSCVYQLIRATPHINYSIFYIGANEASLGEPKYPLPPNVSQLKKLFLFDYEVRGELKRLGAAADPRAIELFHQEMARGDLSSFRGLYRKLFDPDHRSFDPMDIFVSEEGWEIMERMYRARFKGGDAPSFVDYFYSWRFTHYPIFKVLTADLPRADLYHSLCTGYAGLAATVAKLRHQRPFILTEHGIYSHERRIEILQAQWLLNTDTDIKARRQRPVFKDWWIRMFETLGLLAYKEADVITTLYRGNAEKQIAYGADPEKIRIIPNGVDLQTLGNLPAAPPRPKLTVALVGRVVPIKDIKNFIKAMAVVKGSGANFEALIIGPTEEDENYFEDCQQLVELLELKDTIRFTGKLDMKTVYPAIDVLVLSSISEGQPLVILEAYCQGVPVVATDVGSCRELIEGSSLEDRALGVSGKVVPFGRPELLGAAISELLANPELRSQMAATARRRVEEYYQERTMIGNYLGVYNQLFAERWR